jgi:tetratricopeptide (TPR) repeat protein
MVHPSDTLDRRDVAIHQSPEEDSSLKQAEQWLAAARRGGDRSGEASALIDLGLSALDARDVARAVACLTEALTLARALADRPREGDILGNLGVAIFKSGQFDRARQYVEQALMLARAAGDRIAEKLLLERLGLVHVSLGDLLGAIRLLGEALTLARTLGDRQQEADLLWYLALGQAEMGQREQALGYGQAAVDLLEKGGKPQARVFREYLEQYRRDEAAALRKDWPEAAGGLPAPGGITGTAGAGSAPPIDRKGPGYLRMAISAARAVAHFVGSGMKTVSSGS